METGHAIGEARDRSNIMNGQTASIEARGLTKRFGGTLAVDGLSFEVHPGQVTGFLGPNGAGKSTTLRMILGLDRPTAGEALVNGRPFTEHDRPLFEVGALLDPKRSTRAAVRAATSCPSRWPTGSAAHGSTRYSTSSASPASVAAGPVGSRWAWANGWVSHPLCSVTRGSSSSTSR